MGTADLCYWTKMEEGNIVCVLADSKAAPEFLREEGDRKSVV